MGRQVIKSFIKGLVTDGDSPDMPIDSMREMVNVDIDYSSQRLLCRYPYLAYNKLGPLPNPQTPGTDYKLYWVLKYDIGIEILQRNTLLVYRNTKSPRDWQIYSNAPNGGDGEDFELIAEEIDCSQCYPVAVNGNVRIALGNSKDYRIFMPHENLKYFKKNDGTYLVDDFTTVIPQTIVKTIPSTTSTSSNYIYLNGYLFSSVDGFKLQANSAVENNSFSPLRQGKYEMIVAPIFDTNPQQYGAPIANTVQLITKDPVEEVSNTVILTDGAKYKVNTNNAAYWIKREVRLKGYPGGVFLGATQISSVFGFKSEYTDIELEYSTTNGLVVRAVDSSGNLFDLVYISSPQNMVYDATLNEYVYTFYDFSRVFNEVQYKVYYPPSDPYSQTNPGTEVPSGGTFVANNIFHQNGIPKFVVHIVNRLDKTVLHDFGLQDAIPYKPSYTITNPSGYDLFFYANDLTGVNLSGGAQWQIIDESILIDNAISSKGDNIILQISVPKINFNPRISKLGIFARKSTDQTVEADYSLIKTINIRQTDDFTDFWLEEPDYFVFRLPITETLISRSLGFWSVLYSTGDGGFRPYGHTEADIRRKFGILVNRKERLYAGQIDDDEGQSIVAYTPVANGHGQMDVWFKPLIAFTDGSEANLWGVEFQDRLIWFQRNGLWHMDVGDKPRFEYQFHGVYRGTGCPMPKTVAKARDAMFFANYDGIFRLNSGGVQDITLGKINDWWRYEITQAQKDYSVGGYNPKTNEYWLIIPENVSFDTLQESGGYNDPNIDPKPFPTFGTNVYGPENTSSIILIWDNDGYYGEYWRWYRTGTDGVKDSRGKPVVLFSDRNNDWIFVDVDNNSYFWPGDRIDAGGIDKDADAYPIEFSVATQNFGERSFDFIAERVQVLTEPAPLNDLSVSIIRDSQTDATKVEKITFLSADRRPRKLQRKRCATTQIKIEGDNEHDGIPEIREIVYDYFEDMKRP